MSSSDSKLGSVKRFFTFGIMAKSIDSKSDVPVDVLTMTNFLFNSAHLQECKYPWRILRGYFDPWRWDHIAVLERREPNNRRWDGATFQKDGDPPPHQQLDVCQQSLYGSHLWRKALLFAVPNFASNDPIFHNQFTVAKFSAPEIRRHIWLYSCLLLVNE
jgi:hypothetical protein